MGIISRFKDIMSANINALLDKAEDPEKMIDQYLRNLESEKALQWQFFSRESGKDSECICCYSCKGCL